MVVAALDQENDVKEPATTTSSPATTMRRTQAPTAATVPTPVMHSLEDILQRLVPAREDAYGSNPFLVASRHQPDNSSSGEGTVYLPEETNEIVVTSVLANQPTTGKPAGNTSNSSVSASNDSASEAQPTTSVYVVAVVAVIPLAGVILWFVRVQLHKRREVNIILFQAIKPSAITGIDF